MTWLAPSFWVSIYDWLAYAGWSTPSNWLALIIWFNSLDWLARAPWVYDSVSSSTMARFVKMGFSRTSARSIVMVSSHSIGSLTQNGFHGEAGSLSINGLHDCVGSLYSSGLLCEPG